MAACPNTLDTATNRQVRTNIFVQQYVQELLWRCCKMSCLANLEKMRVAFRGASGLLDFLSVY